MIKEKIILAEDVNAFAAPAAGTKITDKDVRKQLRTFLILKDADNEFVWRNSGTINGNAFNMKNCKDSDIYVEDKVNQVLVDDMTNCNVVIGPSSSSVFIRTSKNCKFAIFC